MNTLDELAIKHQTDRASVFTRTYGKPHDYARHYDKLFTPLRGQPIRLLEIGAAGGEGIRMWLEYLTHPQSEVIGIDIISDTNPYNTKNSGIDPRYTFVQGDQSSVDFWVYFIAYYGAGFDVVVDDAGHFNDGIITSFNALWPHVKPGGFYAIEDLGVAYGAGSIFVKPGFPNHISWLRDRIDQLNTGAGIDSIYCSPELVIIKKAQTW